MTDEPQEPDDRVTPEQDGRIRSALAAARATGSTPEDVAGRLDATLADLVAERDANPDLTPRQLAQQRVPGQTRRGGRRGRWLLLAGAASVATIVVLTLPGLHRATSEITSSNGASTSKSSQGRAEGTVPRSGAASTQRAPANDQGVIRLSSRSFRSGVRLLFGQSKNYALSAVPGTTPSRSDAAGQPPCAAGTPPAGVIQQRTVLLDGKPALLEVFRTRRGTRLVRAVTCDGVETVASTRIPAR